MAKELIQGGLYRPKTSKLRANKRELAMGIKVEMEHTSSRKVAREIALDHLTEDPHYYTKLRKARL